MAERAGILKRSGRDVSERYLRPKQWVSEWYDDDMPPDPPATIATGPPGKATEHKTWK